MKHDILKNKLLKRDSYRRFAYIEACLYWGEGITAGQLGKTFGIARQNAQASIEAYRQQHPDSMVYNPSTKRHEIASGFQPHYISQDPLRYLDYLRGNSLTNHFWEDEEWGHLTVTDVDNLFKPHLEGAIISRVVTAIREHKTLEIYYHAKLGGFESLTISPNQLVYASGRYHARAYCHERNRFIDLVLSRILEAEAATEDWVSSEEDAEWNTVEALHFIPNPALPENLKRTLLLDHRLEQGVYTLTKVRVALRGYALREMERVDWKHKIPLWIRVENPTSAANPDNKR
ncbi:WYL domain-containing protein [Thiothrix nivea]|uniref:Transcriptional regulator n=1 Tax=Thiothrix nivea (strain ATCC 35100 / DSM 5205 / JP2) TaxID=870187 RepID=A0A656H9N3_THINJ|nr:WYL domain-containing protein [Thiothrix nivea]EIJ32867.1 transcriptional regulator [Thiothrix nivea DSM 5205]